MLFLDDATLENGCLQVAPGSHRDGRRPNRTDAAGLDLLQMDTSQFDLKQLVPLEVPAGSVVFFGSYLVHCSSPNRSSKDRRALLYSYQPAEYAHARDLMRAQREAEKQSG
jgi:ectoine hydroxylase